MNDERRRAMRKLLVLLLCACLITGSANAASLGLQNAKTFARIGDWENGIKFLEHYILENPEDAEARLLLAECYYNWPDKQTVGEEVVNKNQERGRAQIRILGNLGEEGFQMLLKGIRSETGSVYSECFRMFRNKKDRRAIPELIRCAEDDTSQQWSAIDTLVSIESDREEPDERVVELLMSMLDEQDDQYRYSSLAGAAKRLATLRVRQAVPKVKLAMADIAADLNQISSGDERVLMIEIFTSLANSLSQLTPKDIQTVLHEALAKMGRNATVEFFVAGYDEVRRSRLDTEMLGAMSIVFLGMVQQDSGLWDMRTERFGQTAASRFLYEVIRRFPEVLLEPEPKEILHELAESPHVTVRQGIVGILGAIRDEDALPILLPRLRASRVNEGIDWWSVLKIKSPRRPIGTRRLVRSAASGPRGSTFISVETPIFLWTTEETVQLWKSVKVIGSPKTSEYLLEQLESEDMGWVVTASYLLADSGEGSAIEVLKKRYSDLSGKEDDVTKDVLEAIAAAYQSLSGQPVAERPPPKPPKPTEPLKPKPAPPRRTP